MSRLIVAAFTCLIALISTGSFAAIGSCPDPSEYPYNGCTVNDVRDGGFPYFDQLVNARYTARGEDGDFILNANFYQGSFRSHLYVTEEDILDITKTKYKFKAQVRDDVVTGSVSIKGIIDELGIKGKKKKKPALLMKADLSGEWGSNVKGDLVGFNTMNIVCNDKINDYLGDGGCTMNESVYLSLLESIFTGERNISTAGVAATTAGVAATTVPLPAALWLFGSGLLGLVGIARKKTI